MVASALATSIRMPPNRAARSSMTAPWLSREAPRAMPMPAGNPGPSASGRVQLTTPSICSAVAPGACNRSMVRVPMARGSAASRNISPRDRRDAYAINSALTLR